MFVSGESIAVEIYPKSGSRGQTRSRRADAPEGGPRRSRCVALLGRRYSRLEGVTTTGRCAEHQTVDPSMLPTTDTRDWGLRDRLRVVYYHLRVAGAFPTPSQCFGEGMLFRQVKISCYATKGNERSKSGGGVTRPGKTRMLSRTGDGSRNGDGEVGGKLRKRKGGLIMRVGGKMGSS